MRESRLWFWHLISGLVLIVLLGIHTVIQHFDSILGLLGILPREAWTQGVAITEGALNFQYSVLPRMKMVSMTVIYTLLIVFGLYHGLYGVRSMLYELKISAAAKRAAGVLLLILGVAAGVYGVVTVWQGHLSALDPNFGAAAVSARLGGK